MTESDQELELTRDILQGRKFSLADLIAKEGGDFLKGESPVPKIIQLKTEINFFIKKHLKDSSGALQAVLQDRVNDGDNYISSHEQNPLEALEEIITDILNNEHIYYEFVRQVDLKWGQITGDRPYFQAPAGEAHPDDEYSHESVRKRLSDLIKIVGEG